MASPQQASKWTCHKLECVADFIEMFSADSRDPGCCVELFTATGVRTCREAVCAKAQSGEPAAHKMRHPFSRCIFIASNESDSEQIAGVLAVTGSTNAHIITGNCLRESVMRQLFDAMPRSTKSPSYKHVEDAEPARFSNPRYYHVIWASDRASRANELKAAWGRERFLPCKMFHADRLTAAGANLKL